MKNPLLPVYNRSGITFEYGSGPYLFSLEGKKYLDFSSGIGVTMFGHSHPKIINTMRKQADKLWHVSNSHETQILKKFASLLTSNHNMGRIFFANSGTEAIECGLKTLRNYFVKKGDKNRNRIIVFESGYHGRTMGGLSASDESLHVESFAPYLDWFDYAKFNDIESVKKAISKNTAGILLEPIQGQGGIRVASDEFLKELRKLCDKEGILLFVDEIQCGMGRTGKVFAYEHAGIVPDLIAVAKGFAAGYPIGALMASEAVGSLMEPGYHGSTFGGNPLALAIASTVYDMVNDPKMLSSIAEKGALLKAKLVEVSKAYPEIIEEVRGKGLMLGLKIGKHNCRTLVERLLDVGLITVSSGDNVVRILPSYIIEEEHINEAVEKIKNVCKVFTALQEK